MHEPEVHPDGTIVVVASKHRPRKRAPHPIAVYSHDGPGGKSWTLEHHHHDSEPTEHHYTDGHQLLADLANHIEIPVPEEESIND